MPIDYNRYPPNWKSEIVPAILDRANNCCEVCGLENRASVVSVALKIKDKKSGRYKIKRVWVQGESDIKRMTPLAYSGKVKVVTVVLTVAHLDHDEENHDVTNDRLQAMCQYCHLNYDASEKMRRIMAKGEQ